MMVELEDYTDISKDQESIEKADIKSYSARKPEINLGIYKKGESIRTDRYCGYVWLKDSDGHVVKKKDGAEQDIVLHVKPRFNLDLNTMIQKIAGDEEFFEYLGLDTDEPLFRFFYDEPLIQGENIRENMDQLISVLSFIVLLDRTTRIGLIKRMIKIEENAVGRVRGHLLIHKQLSRNICRGHAERIYSAYNERSEDILENRILLYSLNKAEDYLQNLGEKDTSLLRRVCIIKNRLARVTMNREESYRCEDIDHIIKKLPSIYRNYLPVFEYAKLILMNASVNAGNSKTTGIVPYSVNAHMLYECYVRAIIKEIITKDTTYHIRMLKYVRDKNSIPDDESYGARNVIKDEDNGCYISGKIVPDIILKYEKKTDIDNQESPKEFYRIYDVKYKDGSKCLPQGRDDRLQILAYNLFFSPLNYNTGLIFPVVGEGEIKYKELNIVRPDSNEKFYAATVEINNAGCSTEEAFMDEEVKDDN